MDRGADTLQAASSASSAWYDGDTPNKKLFVQIKSEKTRSWEQKKSCSAGLPRSWSVPSFFAEYALCADFLSFAQFELGHRKTTRRKSGLWLVRRLMKRQFPHAACRSGNSGCGCGRGTLTPTRTHSPSVFHSISSGSFASWTLPLAHTHAQANTHVSLSLSLLLFCPLSFSRLLVNFVCPVL